MNKIKCPHCEKEYSVKGLGTHIWRSHGKGINFIANNQKFPESAYANRQQGKVWVEFLITTTGSIQIVQVRSPYPVFENEARRTQ
mgnify:CR=1 FL=1